MNETPHPNLTLWLTPDDLRVNARLDELKTDTDETDTEYDAMLAKALVTPF